MKYVENVKHTVKVRVRGDSLSGWRNAYEMADATGAHWPPAYWKSVLDAASAEGRTVVVLSRFVTCGDFNNWGWVGPAVCGYPCGAMDISVTDHCVLMFDTSAPRSSYQFMPEVTAVLDKSLWVGAFRTSPFDIGFGDEQRRYETLWCVRREL